MFGISSVKIGIGTKLSNIWLTPTRTSSPLFQDFVFFFFLSFFLCKTDISQDVYIDTLTGQGRKRSLNRGQKHRREREKALCDGLYTEV